MPKQDDKKLIPKTDEPKPEKMDVPDRTETEDLGSLVMDVIKLNKETALHDNVYFFPPFAEELFDAVPELSEKGFKVTMVKSSLPQKEGQLIGAFIMSPIKKKLDLGWVKLVGDDIEVAQDLKTVKQLVNFLEAHDRAKREQ